VFGMVRKLLTDARETSYWILSSLLTAECSTIELPGEPRKRYVFILVQPFLRSYEFRRSTRRSPHSRANSRFTNERRQKPARFRSVKSLNSIVLLSCSGTGGGIYGKLAALGLPMTPSKGMNSQRHVHSAVSAALRIQ
jgi:hypothetical protein